MKVAQKIYDDFEELFDVGNSFDLIQSEEVISLTDKLLDELDFKFHDPLYDLLSMVHELSFILGYNACHKIIMNGDLKHRLTLN